ncbi:MAG: DLW-39 family protein [Actinomycetota bacterium]|nr:DLW-39 family protein [Actinomycetota bacterium]
MRRPFFLIAAVAGVAAAILKKRRGHSDAALWREATSDSSR